MTGRGTTTATSVRRGSNLPRVGDYNQVVVLEAIRRHTSGLSRVEIAVLTGLSAQAVSNICRRLLEQGLVEEAGKQGGGPGKPRTLLRLAPQGRYAVGVHLDPAVATVVVLDLLGHVVARRDHPLRPGAGPGQVLADIAGDVDAVIAESGVDRERIVGLGVAAPGPVDSASGAVVNPPNLPGWSRVNVRDLLAEATGLPVVLDKDVVAAAVGEVWAGGVGGTGSAVFFYLGTGVGAGLVLRGEVYRGASGNSGEVGHLVTGRGGAECPCGLAGCLGESSGPLHLVREAERLGVGRWDLDAGDPSDESAAEPATAAEHRASVASAFVEVCSLADAGHPAASELLEDLACRMAKAAIDVVDMLDVERVVFGGPLWSPLRRTFLRVVPPLVAAGAVARAIHPVEVRGTLVGDDVAAVGAGCLVLEDSFSPRSATLLLEH
ncbi:Sugar kinase of the NBD/HSP70 family, may contain an N-terminal HTH domain [Quadrisphaera granulorum]|uniref:Putative NBD/HSP70 family sugar kinase n=1 Tax=Quadrisphaera granulorum TaxID=317664 RepID=A0A316A755_9ACTN|nr:ROK family transcriptional regulator [Quadrisphaera granulorum]PWJ52810.1 putative NBD/HSP70 family sugar kinase [Quadrisphaera granulorum]SZE97415.1 Sugar kinase of the NBD/HSP70 family, may contain an N-terminal HTH domain [Quadrisphaera granulorum]